MLRRLVLVLVMLLVLEITCGQVLAFPKEPDGFGSYQWRASPEDVADVAYSGCDLDYFYYEPTCTNNYIEFKSTKQITLPVGHMIYVFWDNKELIEVDLEISKEEAKDALAAIKACHGSPQYADARKAFWVGDQTIIACYYSKDYMLLKYLSRELTERACEFEGVDFYKVYPVGVEV